MSILDINTRSLKKHHEYLVALVCSLESVPSYLGDLLRLASQKMTSRNFSGSQVKLEVLPQCSAVVLESPV